MTERNPHEYGPDEHTHRYGPPMPDQGPAPYGQGPYGYPQPQPQQAPPGRSRPSGVFTAVVLVAALVVGGLAGLVGAAGFAAVDRFSDDSAASTASNVTRSAVSNTPDTPADPGSVEAVAHSVLPSVVKINVRGPGGAGSGSGIILSSDGEILTNNHVVEIAGNGGSLSVSFNDGSAATAEIVGTDPVTDLAIIKAQGVSGLQPATLGHSDNLDVGEEVVAIGSPFGLQATVTSGIVSALNRPVSVSEGGAQSLETIYPAIQTDAAINPGNSGGPLVNMNGEVVGINSSIRTASSGSIGLGFAIPLDKVMPIIKQLRNGETPTHARLGVTVTDATSRNGLFSGAGIRTVNAGSAADEAGLRRGDVITKVDDNEVSGAQSLVATIRGYRPGDTVTLTVVHGNDDRTVKVTLDSDQGGTAF